MSKKKKDKDKTYMSKGDSGSETTAFIFNQKPECMDSLPTSFSDHPEDGYMSYVAFHLTNEKFSIM